MDSIKPPQLFPLNIDFFFLNQKYVFMQNAVQMPYHSVVFYNFVNNVLFLINHNVFVDCIVWAISMYI